MTTLYVSPAGTGSGSSSGSPCSLATATAAVAAAGGNSVIWLAGGTYYLAATLDLTCGGNSGIVWKCQTGQVPIISGAKVFAGNWTNTTGSTWTATIASSVDIEQIFVNGLRATRPIAPVPGGGGSNTWAITGTGFTVDATTATALAAWTSPMRDRTVDLRGPFGSEYAYYRVPVTGVSGTAVTCSATVMAQIASISVLGSTIDHTSVFGYSGDPSLCASHGDVFWNSSTGLCTYIARVADSMGASPLVEVATLDIVATCSGSLGSPVSGIICVGIVFEGGGNSGIRANGYAFTGGGMTGSFANYPNGSGYDWALQNVTMSHATGCKFFGCTFRRMGSTALGILRGAQGWRVEGCATLDCLNSGITVGAIDYTAATETDARKHTTGGTVRRTMIQSCGVASGAVATASGLATGYCASCLFDHVTVDTIGEVGIALQGAATVSGIGVKGGNTFNACVVSNYCASMPSADAGGIHTGGTFSPANTISNCYVSTTINGSSVSYYYDNLTDGLLSVNNCTNNASFYVNYQTLSPYRVSDIAATGFYAPTGSRQVSSPAGLVNVTETGTTIATPFGATALALIAAAGV